MKRYLAIDIGASSGRHIVAWKDEAGKLVTEEVYRFPNGAKEENGHLIWDIDALEASVRAGIEKAKAAYKDIVSLSIDTWGVDYVLLKGDEIVKPVYCYRDARTQESIPEVHAIVPFHELYRRTGIAYNSFNTIYQLYADKMAGRLEGVTDFLMLPCYLMYRLCGVKSHEYTNATTGGLVSAETGEYDHELIRQLGLPEELFPALSQPGCVIGTYEGMQVVLCATHDTGSAVEGIPMEGNHPYISSGTWSLLGIKTEKPLTDKVSEDEIWSNEGGVHYNRYQKNIMGMWLINMLQKELCPGKPFPEIVAEAEASHFDETVDANASIFLAPESMKAAFDPALARQTGRPGTAAPELSEGDYFRCAYRSLAIYYKKSLEELEKNTGLPCEKLYIVGGGAKNQFLNRLTEEAIQREVVALPIEATALGNLKIQMLANP